MPLPAAGPTRSNTVRRMIVGFDHDDPSIFDVMPKFLVDARISAALIGLPVETIGSRFGGIPSGLPEIQLPQFRPELMLTNAHVAQKRN